MGNYWKKIFLILSRYLYILGREDAKLLHIHKLSLILEDEEMVMQVKIMLQVRPNEWNSKTINLGEGFYDFIQKSNEHSNFPLEYTEWVHVNSGNVNFSGRPNNYCSLTGFTDFGSWYHYLESKHRKILYLTYIPITHQGSWNEQHTPIHDIEMLWMSYLIDNCGTSIFPVGVQRKGWRVKKCEKMSSWRVMG